MAGVVTLPVMANPCLPMTNGLQGEPMNRDQIKRMMGDEPEPDPIWLRVLWLILCAFLAVYFINL